MQTYQGSCHCGAIRFQFRSKPIESGLRCNCSMCKRKGALMSAVVLSADELEISVDGDALGSYAFGSCVAKHHFCRQCGIYPFHQTLRMPGHYRVNLGCVDGVDSQTLPFEVFNGAALAS